MILNKANIGLNKILKIIILVLVLVFIIYFISNSSKPVREKLEVWFDSVLVLLNFKDDSLGECITTPIGDFSEGNNFLTAIGKANGEANFVVCSNGECRVEFGEEEKYKIVKKEFYSTSDGKNWESFRSSLFVNDLEKMKYEWQLYNGVMDLLKDNYSEGEINDFFGSYAENQILVLYVSRDGIFSSNGDYYVFDDGKWKAFYVDGKTREDFDSVSAVLGDLESRASSKWFGSYEVYYGVLNGDFSDKKSFEKSLTGLNPRDYYLESRKELGNALESKSFSELENEYFPLILFKPIGSLIGTRDMTVTGGRIVVEKDYRVFSDYAVPGIKDLENYYYISSEKRFVKIGESSEKIITESSMPEVCDGEKVDLTKNVVKRYNGDKGNVIAFHYSLEGMVWEWAFDSGSANAYYSLDKLFSDDGVSPGIKDFASSLNGRCFVSGGEVFEKYVPWGMDATNHLTYMGISTSYLIEVLSGSGFVIRYKDLDVGLISSEGNFPQIASKLEKKTDQLTFEKPTEEEISAMGDFVLGKQITTDRGFRTLVFDSLNFPRISFLEDSSYRFGPVSSREIDSKLFTSNLKYRAEEISSFGLIGSGNSFYYRLSKLEFDKFVKLNLVRNFILTKCK